MAKKVLIVEDEEVLRDMYAEKFRQEGVEVIVADSAEEGVEVVKKEMPDLVLLDIILPNKDGAYLMKQMREDPKTANIAVVAFSNYDDLVMHKKIKELGGLAYLLKTDYTPSQVVKKIKGFLEQT